MGRKKALCREWLTRGVRVAAVAGGVDGRAGVSGVLGRLFSRVGWADLRAMQGWAEQAEPAVRLYSFLSFFCFIFLLLYLNSNLIWSLNLNLVYLIHWIFRCEAHDTLLYILGTLFSYFV